MGDINIVREVLDMQNRQNFSDTDLAAIAGTSKTTVGKWFKGTPIKDEYLVNLSNAIDDTRFSLAVNCYLFNLPPVLLNISNDYNQETSSLLIGTKIEDLNSDRAIENALKEISKSNPDENVIKFGIFKMLRTSSIMQACATAMSHRYHISLKQAVLEERG
ncbi:helix-turn-helix domain-containing protein [Companilactobacillus paralimentarius]|uniref:helix-turn-helix domain-containing protein n=2 Tax=Companilactobacillus paralimentarius TaxID=83526 RepID=UPI0037E05B0B